MFYINVCCASIEFNNILVLALTFNRYLARIDAIGLTSLQLHKLLQKCYGLHLNYSMVIFIKMAALCTLF